MFCCSKKKTSRIGDSSSYRTDSPQRGGIQDQDKERLRIIANHKRGVSGDRNDKLLSDANKSEDSKLE